MFPGIATLLLGPIYFSAFVVQRLIGSRRESRTGQWARRLEYGRFVRGTPALAAAALALGAAGWWVSSADRLEDVYAARLHTALVAEEYDVARLCGERLLGLDPRREVYAFSLATAYAGLGDLARAEALMHRLAPPDAPGYPPAQLWIVERRLSAGPPISADELRGLEARLIRLRDVPDYGADAARVSADLYFRTGRAAIVMAEPKLLAAAERTPSLRLPLTEARAPTTAPAVTKAVAEELVAEFRRRLQTRPDDVESRLHLARSELLAGRLDAARSVLQEGLALKDDRRLGTSLAAIDGDLFRLAARPGAPTGVRRGLARRALESLDAHVPPSDATVLERARLLAAVGEFDKARQTYSETFDAFPVARVELAELLAARGRTDDASREYREVLRWYAAADARLRRETPQARVAGPLAAVRLGEFAQAVEWLRSQAADGGPDAPLMKVLLAQACASWSDVLKKNSGEATGEQRLALLTEALEAAPFDPAVLQRLLDLAATDDAVGRMARDRFRRMIVEGRAPASAYLLAGTDALGRGARDEGIRYLEQAFRLNPDSYAALNNLAWGLASGDEPDLPRALTLIDEARRKAPNDLNVRDTRGRILAKLKRWPEALAELEAAAPLLRGNAEYHRATAEVYEALNLHDLARQAREAAQQAQPPSDAKQ